MVGSTSRFLTEPAVDTRLRVGTRIFHILISPVITRRARRAGTDLVQLMVSLDGEPLTLRDLGAATARCSTLWSFLCSKLTEATVDFYDPQPPARPASSTRASAAGAPGPTCWTTAAEDDCVAGGRRRHLDLASGRTGRAAHTLDFVRELGATLAEVLAYWVLRIEQDRAQLHRPPSLL